MRGRRLTYGDFNFVLKRLAKMFDVIEESWSKRKIGK
jgi:hypothetical protein